MVKFTEEQAKYIIPLHRQIKEDPKLKLNVDLTRLFSERFPNTNYTYKQLCNLYCQRIKITK
jgi:hypothetical protein